MVDAILPKVQTIIARQLKCKPEQITPRARLQDELGADSLDAMEIMMSTEEEFNIQIDEADARKMVIVKDIVDYIAKKEAG